MTTITFYKANGFYYGFEEQGHTGYGESGDDVLCAALSSMTMLLINAIEISYASSVDYTIDEKTTDIKVIAKSALPKYENDEKKQKHENPHNFVYYIKKKWEKMSKWESV